MGLQSRGVETAVPMGWNSGSGGVALQSRRDGTTGLTRLSVTEATPLTVKSGEECTPTGVLAGRSRRIPVAPIPPGCFASLPTRPIPEGSPITKYNATDGKKVLDPEDDAATAKLGAPWRMPTEDEIKELVDKCTWTWTTQDGKNGYKVIGPNGNSIFLPAGGFQDNGGLYGSGGVGNLGAYWSSTLSIFDHYSNYLELKSSNHRTFHNPRNIGMGIRPVRPRYLPEGLTPVKQPSRRRRAQWLPSFSFFPPPPQMPRQYPTPLVLDTRAKYR